MARTARNANSIVLNARVRKIECAGTGEQKECHVHTSDGKEYTANGIVVTVPLGVLKKGYIQFEPTLPPQIRDSIQHLGYGSLDKVTISLFQHFTVQHKQANIILRPTSLSQKLFGALKIQHIILFYLAILIQTRTAPHGNNPPSRSLI